MSDLLKNITVVLAGTRFPENVGMAARACANMGVSKLHLAFPELWDREKALPLATPKGTPILDAMRIFPSLSEALDGHGLIVGTTARTGGWRQNINSPRNQADKIVDNLRNGVPVALLFGPEDRGLINDEIMLCHDLVTIPTCGEASSLNLAQAVLVLLYECLMAEGEARRRERAYADNISTQVSHTDYERLMSSLKSALLHIDFLHGDNPDYFFMPLRRFFARKGLKRHEYDAFMGMCRQIRRMTRP